MRAAGHRPKPLAFALTFVALAIALTGCRGTAPDWLSDEGELEELVPPASRPGFESGRLALSEGRLEDALGHFGELVERFPDEVVLATWLQEAELAQADRDGVGAREALREGYRQRAEADPSARRLLLAARIEDDPFAAQNLLRRAREADPSDPWVHYGRAFVGARLGAWNEARADLARALELDPLHLGARRLEAWMLARSGRVPEAAVALQRWIPRAERTGLFSDEQLVSARIDLALLHVLDGHPRHASALLRELDLAAPARDAGRRLTVRAGVDEALGDPQAALEAAAEAELRDPESLLPVVQQALLYEDFLEDPEAARAAWRRVLARAEDRGDLKSLLQRTRARIRLESVTPEEEREDAGR